MRQKIVLTGGPGSGKTTILKLLQREESLKDYIFFDELARKLLSDPEIDNSNKASLHQKIYNQQIEREDNADDQSFISDRGTIDAFAFHPETINDVGTTISDEYLRYTQVIQLGTAASLGEVYYKNDDIRNESISDALEIEKNLQKVWSAHPGYVFITANTQFYKKYIRVIEVLSNCNGN